LIHENRKARDEIWQARDLLFTFQIDPQKFGDKEFISKTILHSITHIEELSMHPWIKENYIPEINELITSLKNINISSKKLIKVRLNPQELFPALNIANTTMQPLNASITHNLQLAIQDIEGNHSNINHDEYHALIELRHYWTTMISNFRMYLLNQLNAFQESFRASQLHLITEHHQVIKTKLNKLEKLNKQGKLKFTTSLALEKIQPAAQEWMTNFSRVKRANESDSWRTDTIIYQNELKPQMERINALLRTLDLGIEEFSSKDLNTLSTTTQLQVTSIWTAAIVGLLVLITGFIFLVKLILNPINNVTQALRNESKGITGTSHKNISLKETKDLITAFNEMHRQIHTRQQELEYHALHDELTGLANRKLLTDRLDQAIHNAQQERTSFAILIMDLDRFKEVNDTLGHEVGDKLLQQVAKRLVNLLREVDIIVRLGGDEFAVLLTKVTENHAEKIADKIIKGFQNVFTVNDTPLYIGVSIGIAVYPQHGITTQTLQQRADVAMYVAKRNKSGYDIYNPQYDEYSVGKLSLISDLRNAIDNNQLFMEYQPIIDITTGEVISAEALIRCDNPERGKIYPDEIITIAEQTGMINPITYWIIDTTAKYSNKLKDAGINIKIAINLSVYNLQENHFIENMMEIFNKNKISPTNFIMEVTESVMMTNPVKSIDILNQLHQLGIEIAIDDFGTGYSSLAYLKKLPLSKLKIDKSFIMDMLRDDNDAIIVRSTIDLAHNLGMKVIAEGIEEKEMLQLLYILGCEHGQGYYISRPKSEEELKRWILNQDSMQIDGIMPDGN
ncbi:MAG: EAL domain-containing protein, partial [Gammaproteobacteria bacterium]|nr:EAL domain-containing protein [Gammaproteobacteria bacterium]